MRSACASCVARAGAVRVCRGFTTPQFVTRLMYASDVLLPINLYENTVTLMKGSVHKVTQ